MWREKGAILAERAMVVRGIMLKTERLAAGSWLDALSGDLAALAGTRSATHAALA